MTQSFDNEYTIYNEYYDYGDEMNDLAAIGSLIFAIETLIMANSEYNYYGYGTYTPTPTNIEESDN